MNYANDIPLELGLIAIFLIIPLVKYISVDREKRREPETINICFKFCCMFYLPSLGLGLFIVWQIIAIIHGESNAVTPPWSTVDNIFRYVGGIVSLSGLPLSVFVDYIPDKRNRRFWQNFHLSNIKERLENSGY